MKKIQQLLPVLFIVLVSLVAFYKIIFLQQVFYYGDNFHLNAPLKSLLVSEIRKGEFPLWDPYLFMGMPYFADLNLGTLYPLNFLYFIFSPLKALSIQIVIDIFLISFFTYLLLLKRGLSWVSSLFGGILFGFCGETFQYIHNITILNQIVYIPLIFLILESLKKSKKFIYLNLLIFSQTLQILSGHPQITYYTMLFSSIYLFSFFNSFKAKIATIIYYLFFSTLLASIQLLPFIELILHGNRPFLDSSYAISGGLDLVGVSTFLFPTIFGNVVDGTWWGRQTALFGYIGIPSLVLLLLYFKKSKFENKKFFTFLAFFAIVCSLGLPIVNLLIPGMIFFRVPTQILIFYAFFISIIISSILEYISEKNIKSLSVIKYFFAGTCFLLLISTTAYVLWNINYTFLFIFIKNHIGHSKVLSKLAQLNIRKFQFIFSNAFYQVLLFSLFSSATLFILLLKHKLITKWKIVLLIVLSINLLYFDSKIILSTNFTNLHFQSTIPNNLTNDLFRIATLPVNLHTNKNKLPGKAFFLTEANANLAIYRGDNNLWNTINQVNGYSSIILKDYAYYARDNSITSPLFPINEKTKTDASSIKYIFSNTQLDQSSVKEFQLINQQKNRYIYKNPSSKDRIYPINCTQCKIFEENIQPNEITFFVNTNKRTKIIIADQFYPGWQATANMKNIPIMRFEKVFRSIEVDKGKWFVQMKYNPISFRIGFISSIFFSLLLLLLSIKFKNKIIKL